MAEGLVPRRLDRDAVHEARALRALRPAGRVLGMVSCMLVAPIVAIVTLRIETGRPSRDDGAPLPSRANPETAPAALRAGS